MSKTQITIIDIAKALNISPSTVSRALKNHPDISKATIEKVQKCAAELKYKPNAMALNLRMRTNNTIGIIIPEFVHFFFASILSGIEEIAYQEDFNIIVSQTNEKYEKEIKITESLINARVAGILACLSKESSKYDHFQSVVDNDIPLVFYDRICIDIRSDRVVVDDYAGALHAVEHLIKTGCKRIAFYSSPAHLEISKNRKNGYLDALRRNHIPVDESLIFEYDTREKAATYTPDVLKGENPPDAFLL